MASYTEAIAARNSAFETLTVSLHMRPLGAGLVTLGPDNYGLKVMLPRRPAEEPPKTVDGVPVEYSIAAEPVQLLSAPSPGWRRKSLARRDR